MSGPVQASVRYGSADISLSVIRRPRRSLAITVHPDCRVTVAAPADRAMAEVLAKVKGRAAWILRQQMRFRDLHPLPPPRVHVSGETHWYLGRQYRLRVLRSEAAGVALRRPFLEVRAREVDNAAQVERMVNRWLVERARAVLVRQFEKCLEAHPGLRTPETRVVVRRMANRWGSCTKGGTITLNPLLVQAPAGCIEYVILHELCHRKEMNHGPRFERLLSRVLPDWRRRRLRLRDVRVA